MVNQKGPHGQKSIRLFTNHYLPILVNPYYNLSTSCFLRLIFKAVSYNLFIFGML